MPNQNELKELYECSNCHEYVDEEHNHICDVCENNVCDECVVSGETLSGDDFVQCPHCYFD